MPDQPAAVDDRSQLTWRELTALTEARTQLLLRYLNGHVPEQACIVAPNGLNLLPWMAALATLGVPATGLDYTLPTDALHDVAMQLNADLLLVSSSARGECGEALDFGPMTATRFDLDSVTLSHLDRAAPPESGIPAWAPEPRPFRSVGLTSGTSGAPKTVVRTKSFDQRRFKYFTDRYEFGQRDRFLVSMPLYHAAGNGWARMFMSLGATLYLVPVNSPADIADALHRHEITASVMTPSVLDKVLDALEHDVVHHKLALRWLLVGGKHFPVPQKTRALTRLGYVVFEYYGTTETGVNTVAEPHDLLIAPESVGRPIDGNRVVIVDLIGTPLAPLAVGTVAVASYMNMDCYGDGTSAAIMLDGERYLLTPDQGYLDQEGRLFLVNRSADAKNGARLYRLEDAIRGLPCVADVALLQRDDTNIDCALVIRDAILEPQEIHERVRQLAQREQLAVARYRDVPQIPYSPTGKIRIRDVASYFNA